MSGTRRAAALLLTFATGSSGLVYEVTWQKYLAILLGSHAEATAAVLGIFLAGLSLGYALFGKVTGRLGEAAPAERPRRLLRLYAGVEGAIGVYALAFPWLFELASAASLSAPLAAGPGFAFDVLLTAVLIGPPAVLMGGTIPVLTQALAHDVADATRIHARIYAFNTAGACVGALAASFVLVPALGLVGTLAAAAAVNLAAAAFFGLLARREAAPGAGEAGAAAALREPLDASDPGAVASAPAGVRAHLARLAGVALLVGFAMMVVQTVAIRVAGLAFGASPFTFAMVVAVFVLCIALGSAAVSLLRGVPAPLLLANHVALLVLALGLHGFVDEAPFYAHRLRTAFGTDDASFDAFFLAGAGGVLLWLGPVVLLSGASLPLLFHNARRTVADLGSTAGALYAWNTVGSLAGALLGGYALLFFLDLDQVYRVALAALAAAAALLVFDAARRARAALAAGAALAAALAIAALPAWNPELLCSGLFRYRQRLAAGEDDPLAAARSVRPGALLVFHRDDPTTSVTVNEWRSDTRIVRSILTNGKPDGTTSGQDWATMSLAALVPALLAERAESAFVIGWGTGITVGELAALPGMREVVVAEISPGVIEAAPLFDFANGGASSRAGIEVIRSDAYRALLRTGERFDVIVSEPSNPWVTGVEMLYSREFLETARTRLREGGIYAQWYHQYETDRASLDLVLRTYTTVFERVAVWYGGASDLLLLGFRDPAAEVDLARLVARSREPALREALERAGIPDVPSLLAHELLPAGVLNALALPEQIHTLTHPRLAHLAARAFFRGSHVPLPFTGYGEPARIAAERALLPRHLEALPPAERAAAMVLATEEACRRRADQCGAFLGNLALVAPRRARTIVDETAERQLFGGRVAPALIPDLASLVGELGEASVPIETAARRLDLYQSYYQHGMPFLPQRLLDLWQRCADPEHPRACEQGRELAEGLLETGVAAESR